MTTIQPNVSRAPSRSWLLFSCFLVLGAPPAMIGAYDVRAAPLFAMGVLLWGLLPLGLGLVLFAMRRWYVAWGWLIAVLAYRYVVLAMFAQSGSSTAVISFLWAPVWSIAVVGPLGALVGFFLSRRLGAGRK